MCLKEYFLLVVLLQVFVVCSAKNKTQILNENNGLQFVGRLLEEGRTLVHHTVKRFMIILPAIFFKLGIAFTLLVLVTIVAINNGFIGFLILVVGLSSVLARLQEARRPSTLGSYFAPLPYHHHAHFLDRSDNIAEKASVDTSVQSSPSTYQYYSNSRPYSAYSQQYYGSKVA